MIEARGYVSPLPVVASAFMLLALSPHARPQEKSEPLASNTVRCLLAADGRTWRKGESAIITVKVEDLTDKDLNLEIVPEFFLVGGDEYSAPTDIVHDRPIGMQEVSPKKGEAVGLRPVGLKLRLNARSTAIFEVDAAKTKWARTISSVWPSQPLSDLPSGHYLLRLEFQDAQGMSVRSNGIVVVLQN